jgi:hypothetical protein
LQDWVAQDVFLKVWRALLAELDDNDKLHWDECFAHGSFTPAKKEATKSAQLSAAGHKLVCAAFFHLACAFLTLKRF